MTITYLSVSALVISDYYLPVSALVISAYYTSVYIFYIKLNADKFTILNIKIQLLILFK